ncbi:hypothetical protein MNV49_004722 [Pseudohyphozyma bogoriensis]|nr:hypothetical protein MNV49_004722 [Pseudohyphozyma bogoriensis]
MAITSWRVLFESWPHVGFFRVHQHGVSVFGASVALLCLPSASFSDHKLFALCRELLLQLSVNVSRGGLEFERTREALVCARSCRSSQSFKRPRLSLGGDAAGAVATDAESHPGDGFLVFLRGSEHIGKPLCFLSGLVAMVALESLFEDLFAKLASTRSAGALFASVARSSDRLLLGRGYTLTLRLMYITPEELHDNQYRNLKDTSLIPGTLGWFAHYYREQSLLEYVQASPMSLFPSMINEEQAAAPSTAVPRGPARHQTSGAICRGYYARQHWELKDFRWSMGIIWGWSAGWKEGLFDFGLGAINDGKGLALENGYGVMITWLGNEYLHGTVRSIGKNGEPLEPGAGDEGPGGACSYQRSNTSAALIKAGEERQAWVESWEPMLEEEDDAKEDALRDRLSL